MSPQICNEIVWCRQGGGDNFTMRMSLQNWVLQKGESFALLLRQTKSLQTMKKAFTIFTACFFVAAVMNAQDFEWARAFGGPDKDRVYSISVDASGNIYTTGYFYGTVDFDPGPGTYNLTSVGEWDIFIQKLDASGNFIWAKSFGTIEPYAYPGWEAGISLSIDASGNIYTTGWFGDVADFDPDGEVYPLFSEGERDIFIQKLDASGDFVWAKSFGGVGVDRAFSLSIDALGNIYTTGCFYDTVDFDPGAEIHNLTAEDNVDIFIQKLDASGNFIWAKSFGSEGNADVALSLGIDALGNIYTSGIFEGTADFDPGAGTYFLTSEGDVDGFVQKLDASGNFVWAKSFGSTGWDAGNSLSIDAAGNVYVTGDFKGTVDFDPGAGIYNLTSAGEEDVFIQKLDASGNFVWAKSFGSADHDISKDIYIDSLGNIYTTGWFGGTVDFDPGTGTYNLTSAGYADAFIQKLDASGNFVWAKSFGSAGGGDGAFSLSLDALGNVYTAGIFQETADFDPGADTYNLSSEGDWDVFIHKMSQPSVGVVENDFGRQLLVHPNPSAGDFVIDLGDVYDLTEIAITDMNGKLVYASTLRQTQKTNISLKKVPAGVYLLRIQSGKKRAVVKLVKD